MVLKKSKNVTPGEKVAVIEEFSAGKGTYLLNGEVFSLKLGEVAINLKDRVININQKQVDRIPKYNDIITGIVDSAQSNTINVCIDSINGKESRSGFTGMLQVGFDRSGERMRGRRITVCKAGDIIRARIKSVLNANIHLSIDNADEGVIYTVCSICGGNVTANREKVKCVECGNIEERKLASDFATLTAKVR